jgi:hypothetical protein
MWNRPGQLIEQAFFHVEHRSLAADGSWSTEINELPHQIVHLSEPGIDLQLAQIYEGVEVSPRPAR